MARLDTEIQDREEPKRIEFAVKKIEALGHKITHRDDKKIQFEHRGNVVTLYPYSGWHTGKTITDGRGLENLLKQIR